MALGIIIPVVQLQTSRAHTAREFVQLTPATKGVIVCAALAWLYVVAQSALYAAQRLLTLPARLRTETAEQLRRGREDGLPDASLAELGTRLAEEARRRYRAQRAWWLSVAAGGYAATIILFTFAFTLIGVRDTSGACTRGPAGVPSWQGQGPCDGHFAWSAFHLSVATVTTLGYGDVQPYGNVGRVLSDVEVLAGIVYIGVFIAGLTRVLETTDFEQH